MSETTQVPAETTVGDDPSVPSAAYRRMEPRWTKCRDVMVGTEAIRAGGTDYLPQLEGETDDGYDVRSVLAAFYNAYARTVQATVGMLLEEEPTLGDDMPAEVVELWENIDAAGTHGAVFARRLATAGLVDGYAGVLTEHSKRPVGPLSEDDEKRLGLRPYLLLFRAHDIYRMLYETVNGVRTLVLLILRETVTERVGKFGVKTVEQFRIYTNDKGTIEYQLWKSAGAGAPPQLDEGPSVVPNLTEIPWSLFVAGEELSPGEYKPPLIDLADLNLQYHASLTNHLSLQTLAYVPTPVRIGAKVDQSTGEFPELVLGPRQTIEAPVIEGVAQPIYWTSPPVDVLGPGERTMTQTKAEMGSMGASFLAPETRAAETAEGKRIDSAAQRATIATVARALKDCLESALGFMAKYRRQEGGSVTLNDNFTGEQVDPQYLRVLVEAYQAENPAVKLEELRHVLQTGQLPEDFDSADITDLLVEAEAKRQAKAERMQLLADAQDAPAPPMSEAAD